MSMSVPRIKEVRAYTKKAAPGDQGADCHDVMDTHWINGHPTPIANPMSRYPQYKQYRKSWGINALGSVVVEVEATDGTTGVGVSIGGDPACYLIEKHLSKFVEGQEANAIELMWDQMWRASTNYGRKGLTVQAISAVDLALWDLWGKICKLPVYQLLGGPVRTELPLYCTTARPDVAKEMGFVGSKIPCPYGPSDGDEGLRENVKFFSGWREKLGPDFPLALDCYMALSVPYSIKLARALEPYNLKWMEEFLHPDDYNGYAEVRKALQGSTLLTTGEHEYTRYGFLQLLQNDCADILQPDVTWVGGITEVRRIIAMASAYDRLVIPHGSSVYSYHLQTAFTNTPIGEFINLHPTAEELAPYFGGMFPDEPMPKNGRITIDQINKPGFGVTLNKTGLERPYSRSAETVRAQAEANEKESAVRDRKLVMPF
eukprot:PhM_4_TR15741/c0_g1_i1/m.91918/K12661/LRA3, yfaW; L-rhamnonate dehydratase